MRVKVNILASIGPCPFKHGKVPNPLRPHRQHMLQLGHVLSNMVSHRVVSEDGLILLLQLGHVLSNMVRAHIYMRTLKADKRCLKAL